MECIASICIFLHLFCYCLFFFNKFNLYTIRSPPQWNPIWKDESCMHGTQGCNSVGEYPASMLIPFLQVWPPDFEDLLTRGSILELPPAQLNVELYQYVKIVCTMLDVPVYKNIIESLHVLFTLYSEFKANQHFQSHEM